MEPNDVAFHEISWNDNDIAHFWHLIRKSPLEASSFARTAGPRFVDTILNFVLKTDEVLDFGCGSGFLMKQLINRGYKTGGYDIAPDPYDLVESDVSESDNFLGIFEDIPSERKFDVVVASEVYEHILSGDLASVRESWVDLLKPGGRLVVTTPHRENLIGGSSLCPECGCFFHKWQHQRSVSAENLSLQFEAMGMQTQHVGAYDFSNNCEPLSQISRYQRSKEKLEDRIVAAISHDVDQGVRQVARAALEAVEQMMNNEVLNDQGFDYREGAGNILIYVASKD